MAVLVTILAVVVALLAVLVVGLLRSHAEILRALHDLGAGSDPARTRAGGASRAPVTLGASRVPPRVVDDDAAHDVAGVTPGGDAVAIGVLGADHPTLLAFLSSGCLTCHGFWEALADPSRLVLPADARVVVVTMGPEAESEGALRGLAPDGLPVVMSSEAWDRYAVPGSPYFVYVDGPSGAVVGEGSAQDWGQVVELMARAANDGLLGPTGALDERAARAARRGLDDRAREERADAALRAAGIEPGHPSLYAPGTAPGGSDAS